MNGGHDLGGMHGFGAIDPEPQDREPVFHAPWEKRIFGMVRAVGSLGKWNSDMSRHSRERQHPADYLRHSYYENWLAGLEKLLVETGLITAEELATGKAEGLASPELRRRILKVDDFPQILDKGSPVTMPGEALPRFKAGDRVRAVNQHPIGHTRQPRYVRGRTGTIVEHHGCHVFPDLNARGIKTGRHLYNVRFEARELWGPDADPNGHVFVDLWEDYLEPAP